MKLLKKLDLKQYCNELHKSVVAVILLYLTFKYPYFIVLLCLYIIYLFKDKTQFKLALGLVLVFGLYNIYYKNKTNHILPNELTGVVVEIEEKYVILDYDNYYILAYSDDTFKVGDVIRVNLKYSKIKSKSYDTDFDLKEYYYSKNIFHVANITSYQVIGNKFCKNTIKYNIIDYLKSNLKDNTYLYVKAIVLGENDLDEDLKKGYSMLGISHILAISGLHIMLLYKALSLIFKKYLNIRYDLIPIGIITIYVLIIGIPPACMRALLFLIIGSYDKYKSIKFTKLDILSISFIITLLIKPYVFYSSSFILTYLVSFILCFSNELIRVKSKLLYNYLIYILIYFITFPITIGFNNYLSVTSFILSPVLTIITSIIIIPLSFIVCLVPSLNNIIESICSIFNLYINSLSDIKIGFDFVSFNFINSIIYYFLYFIILINISKRKKIYKSITVLLLYLLLVNNISYITPINKVTFIDCGQGDSSLVEIGNKKVLIDAYDCYDYLIDKRINKIDYIILTHSDNDHIKDIDKILDYANVSYVLYPKYDDFKMLKNKCNLIEVESSYEFNINGITFNILSPIEDLKDSNSNSIVLQFKLDLTTYLFCGDITIETEKLLIERYNLKLNSDVLKVAHHGSASSSSYEFIRIVSPKYSIISVKENNIYNLPNDEVIKRLKKYSNVLYTYEKGNIRFIHYKNKIYLSPK